MRVWRLVLAGALAAVLLAPVAHAYPRDDAAVVKVDIVSRADVHRLNELGMDIMTVRDGAAQIAAIPSESRRAVGERVPPDRAPLEDDRRRACRSRSRTAASTTATRRSLPTWPPGPRPTRSSPTSSRSGTSYEGREIWALKITRQPDHRGVRARGPVDRRPPRQRDHRRRGLLLHARVPAARTTAPTRR